MSTIAMSRTAEITLDRPGWVRLGVGGLAMLALYAPTFPSLVREWAEFPTLSHGFAIPVIAAYMLWRQRESMAGLPHSASWLWFPALVVWIGVYVAGMRGGESFVARISFPLALLSTALFLSGPQIGRKLLPGIGFLCFMIPLPWVTLKALTEHARLFDATVTAMVLPWLGVPVLQNGYLLTLPNMTLEVADMCSSIPGIAAMLALGTFYGSISHRPRAFCALLVVATIPLAIGSNIVRIVLTAIGVYWVGPIVLHSTLHAFNGTVLFVMTFAALILLDTILVRLWAQR